MRMAMAAVFGFTAMLAQAHADCADDINRALPMVQGLPDSGGRSAVLLDIARARDSRHEGDEQGCREQMREVFAVLCPAKTGPAANNKQGGGVNANPACQK